MAFHGGLAGAAVGIWLFARKIGVNPLTVADLCAAVVPIGIFLGRVANFIKPELWGRPTDVAWGMVFPGAGSEPRHPSQLYEATLEGLVLLVVLLLIVRAGGFRRPGLVAGAFGIGYGVARIAAEFFREPDAQLQFVMFDWMTRGQQLSVPMVVVGIAILLWAYRQPVNTRSA